MQRPEELQQNDLVKLILDWQTSPRRFAIEALGVIPTSQQSDLLNRLGELARVKIKKWNTPHELTAEEEVLSKKVGISVMSAKGTGKDAVLSWCILWFLCCFRNSKIPMTGVSYEQMKIVLIAEIAKWANRIDKDGNPCFVLKDIVQIGSDKIWISMDESPGEEGKSWFAKLRTAPKGSKDEVQSKTMDGLHADYMMVAVDEADGVPDAILKSLDTTLTSPVNFMLLIFNPTKNYGYAYRTQYDREGDYFIKLQWSALDSENVTADQVERMKRSYPEGSPEYNVNVLGIPPEQTEGTLIPQQWLDAAVDRDITPDDKTPRIMGVDPSRQGGDPAGIVIRDGGKILDLIEFRKLDTNELSDEIVQIFSEWECDMVYIDSIGNGAGVYDVIKRRLPGRVRAVDVSTKARSQRYKRLRDELWWRVRMGFENNTISIPSKIRLYRQFYNELLVMRRETEDDTNGKIKIESKIKMKSRGARSPNLADAFMVTMYANELAFDCDTKKCKARKDPYDDLENMSRFDVQYKENAWLGV